MSARRLCIATVALSSLAYACRADEPTEAALGLNGPAPFLKTFRPPAASFNVHPFSAGSVLKSFELGHATFPEAVREAVNGAMASGLSVQMSAIDLPDAVAAGGQRYEGHFAVN